MLFSGVSQVPVPAPVQQTSGFPELTHPALPVSVKLIGVPGATFGMLHVVAGVFNATSEERLTSGVPAVDGEPSSVWLPRNASYPESGNDWILAGQLIVVVGGTAVRL